MTHDFAVKREQWIQCLGGNDRNSIIRQVHMMIWNAASFRIINEARRLAPTDIHGSPCANGLLHNLLDQCFFESQTAAVRRQLDPCGLTGLRAVFSLRSLIDDMARHRSLLTRRNMFASAGLVMDLDAAVTVGLSGVVQLRETGRDTGWPSRETDVMLIRALHADFDALSGVSPNGRSPDDVVSAGVFAGLSQQLSRTEAIRKAVDTLVAHAATPESRSRYPADALAVTLSQLWHAHEIICRSCQFIDRYLLRHTTHKFLAIADADVLQYLDRPIVTTAECSKLRAIWGKYDRETDDWSDTPIDWAISRPATT